MESMFVWIVVFAGAAIALLAVFLVASEKELKKKRLEIDDLLVKLGQIPPEDSQSASIAPDVNSEELDKLRARNQELEKELASISTSADTNQQFDEEIERAMRDVEIAKSNAQWLQNANDELKAEIDELKKLLQTNAAAVTDITAQPQERSDHEYKLASDVADLQQQLAESRAKIRELDGVEQKLANVAVIEETHRNEQQSLQIKIAELERELAASAVKIAEIDELRQRLTESERTQQLHQDERNRFEQEAARLRNRLSDAEEYNHRLDALREAFDQLRAKQATLQDHQREYQNLFANFSQVLATANAGAHSAVTFNEFHSEEPVDASQRHGGAEGKPDGDDLSVTPNHIMAATHPGEKSKRMFGVFPVLVALAFAGAVGAGLWSLKSSDTTAPATVTASALPARGQNLASTAVAVDSKPTATVSEPASIPDAPAATQIAKATLTEKTEVVKPAKAVKAENPVAGTYEVTQTSRVYAAPSELSQAMGDIEPGVKVNVVNAKNGWLEIHSKHGRPPGFIRKEAARIVAQN